MVEQNRSGAYTQFTYAPTGQKMQIVNGQAPPTKEFVALPGGGQAVFTASGQYYYHSDHLGSFRFASTSTRAMYFDPAHAPFGDIYASSGGTDPAFTGQPTYNYVYDRSGNRWQQNGPHSMQLTFSGTSALRIINTKRPELGISSTV